MTTNTANKASRDVAEKEVFAWTAGWHRAARADVIHDVVKLIHSAPAKQSDLDPAPTWLVKDCVHLVAPFVTHLFNTSLSTGSVPDAFKAAYITPLLK